MGLEQPIYGSQELAREDCLVCGIVFMVPARFQMHAQQQGSSFHCPNGHSLSYTKSEVQKLREQVSDLAKKNSEITLKFWAEQSRANKLAHRISKGVCPCCRRSFQNLGRHMKTKHPDFK